MAALRGSAGSSLYLHLAWRHAWRRPFQSVFFVIGVAIGVAMIVAIDLANSSAGRAFELGTEAVTGRATHQIVGGPSGLDQQIYVEIRRRLGYHLSAPVVLDYVRVQELDGQPVQLLGIDLFAEAPFRNYLGTDRGEIELDGSFLRLLMAQPDTVLISATLAERHGLALGSQLQIEVGARQRPLTIVGLMAPADAASQRALDGLLLVDIATAQEVLGREGRLDRIDLLVGANAQGEADLARLRALLPANARLEPTGARAGTAAEMTAAFRLNLTALSLLALVVGIFLIYNTVSFSVVQRRAVLGSLRALGMTRGNIFTVILVEAGLLGLLGTAGGLGLGIFLGRNAVQLVTQTINDLFFVVAVRETTVSGWTLVKGAFGGLGAALVAAVIPALEATHVAPAGALQRSQVEERVRRALPWISGGGLLMAAVGTALLLPSGNLVITFAGLFAIVIGIALLTPALVLGLMSGLQALVGSRLGLLMRMAPRDIVRSLSRTSVAIAALMVAVSVIIGVGVMIGSFRLTVGQWLDEILQADIYVTAPSLAASQVGAALPPAIEAALAAHPGVLSTATSREVDVETVAFGTSHLVALNRDLAGSRRRYKAAVGDWQVTWQAAAAGGVIINEPMANRYQLTVGDALEIYTDRGPHTFTVVGVIYGFDTRSVVILADPVYRQFWHDGALSGVALFAADGFKVDELVYQLREAYAGGENQLLIRSNRGLRESALVVFDRTFAITVALQLLATLVAFVGILSTLMSLQLERQRELGVLRATGMTRRQLWQLMLLETGLIGTSAGLVAMPVGLIMAVILIYIINLRSFGWTLQLQLQPAEFLQAFVVALAAALLAGIYPAWRMGRTQPADALRAE